jgi:ABC-2 type transport system permease protein
MTTMTVNGAGVDRAGTRSDEGSHAFAHARVMLRRNLRHMQRYPSLTLMVTLMPLVFLLLFVYVFGGTLGAGLGSGMPAGLPGVLPSGGRAAYADYLAPAIIVMAVAAAAQGTAIAVAQDMTEGIIARFRTMAVARAAVLTGHVVGATIQTLIGVAVVTAAALAVGFRPHANAAEWLAAGGVVLLLTFALTWLCVGLGLSAKSVETASNSPMFLILLPFLGSGFVPTSSLPVAIRWFAEYQPFTPVNETLRGLLTGTRIGDNLIITVAWCVGVAALSYVWSRRLYEREPKPR